MHEVHEHDVVHVHHRSSFGSVLLGVLIGGVIGSGVALLSAPRSGMETRRMLSEKGSQIKDNAAQMVDRTRERAGEVVDRTRERAGEVVGSVRDRAGGVVESVRGRIGSGRSMSASRGGKSYEALRRENTIMQADADKNYDL